MTASPVSSSIRPGAGWNQTYKEIIPSKNLGTRYIATIDHFVVNETPAPDHERRNVAKIWYQVAYFPTDIPVRDLCEQWLIDVFDIATRTSWFSNQTFSKPLLEFLPQTRAKIVQTPEPPKMWHTASISVFPDLGQPGGPPHLPNIVVHATMWSFYKDYIYNYSRGRLGYRYWSHQYFQDPFISIKCCCRSLSTLIPSFRVGPSLFFGFRKLLLDM